MYGRYISAELKLRKGGHNANTAGIIRTTGIIFMEVVVFERDGHRSVMNKSVTQTGININILF